MHNLLRKRLKLFRYPQTNMKNERLLTSKGYKESITNTKEFPFSIKFTKSHSNQQCYASSLVSFPFHSDKSNLVPHFLQCCVLSFEKMCLSSSSATKYFNWSFKQLVVVAWNFFHSWSILVYFKGWDRAYIFWFC